MKTVVFTQRVEIIDSYNERRDCADQRIADFIWKCGFVPIPLPNDPEKVDKILEITKPSGIILTGGNSLVKYGGNAPERDRTDAYLVDKAVKENTPLYGFCRGMQSILDYYGNEMENVSGHVAVTHIIQGEEDEIRVNSYHNQACRVLKTKELEVVMSSEDGVIEKVRHRKLSIVGTMWHPEREDPYRNVDIYMIKKLFGGLDL